MYVCMYVCMYICMYECVSALICSHYLLRGMRAGKKNFCRILGLSADGSRDFRVTTALHNGQEPLHVHALLTDSSSCTQRGTVGVEHEHGSDSATENKRKGYGCVHNTYAHSRTATTILILRHPHPTPTTAVEDTPSSTAPNPHVELQEMLSPPITLAIIYLAVI